MTDPEVTRQTAHVLLDALSAFDDSSNPDPNAGMRLALRRLQEIDAVSILYDDETDTRTVDAQPLLQASLNLLTSAIVTRLNENPNLPGVDVITELREVTDLT